MTAINSLNAQTQHPVETLLTEKFGPVLSRDYQGQTEFTVSAQFNDVANILNLVNANELYLYWLSASFRDDGKVALIIRTGNKPNNTHERFADLARLLQAGVLPWKSASVPENMAVITTIETAFDRQIILTGETRQSSLIFSHLFPLIERTGELQEPFFSRGTYSDTPEGRVMTFTVNCRW